MCSQRIWSPLPGYPHYHMRVPIRGLFLLTCSPLRCLLLAKNPGRPHFTSMLYNCVHFLSIFIYKFAPLNMWIPQLSLTFAVKIIKSKLCSRMGEHRLYCYIYGRWHCRPSMRLLWKTIQNMGTRREML